MPTSSILINYNDYPLSLCNLMPDNGLAYLAGSLLAKGHQTVIFDYATVSMVGQLFPHQYHTEISAIVSRIMEKMLQGEQPPQEAIDEFQCITDQVNEFKQERLKQLAIEIGDYIAEHHIDFIGFKLWTGQGFSGSVLLAKELKRRFPHLPIIAGGPHIHWFHETVFDVTDAFNILVDSDGEDAIWMLADYVEGKRTLDDIPNLIYRHDGQVVVNPITHVADLNVLAEPVYDEEIYPAMGGNDKIKIILLDESRGCPNACHFCIHPRISGRNRRLAEPDRFVERVIRMNERYGFRAFRFSGSNPPQSLTCGIAQRLIERNVDIVFATHLHARGLRRETLELLHRAGCRGGFIGLESGSPEILDQVMNKKTTVEQMYTAFTNCKEVGIPIVASVIIPTPHGTEATDNDTFKLLIDVKPDSTLVCFPGLIPGSEWGDHPERYGFAVDDSQELFKQMMVYNIDLFSPPILWKPIDGYMLEGRDFREIAIESYNFEQRIEHEGLVTQITDEMFLMASAAQIPLLEFKDRCLNYILTGDHLGLQSIVQAINDGLTTAPEKV